MGEGNVPPGLSRGRQIDQSRVRGGVRFAHVALGGLVALIAVGLGRPAVVAALDMDLGTTENVRTLTVASLQYAVDYDQHFPLATTHQSKALAVRGFETPLIAPFALEWPTYDVPLRAYGVRPEHLYSRLDPPMDTLIGRGNMYHLTGSSFEYEFSAAALHLTVDTFAVPGRTILFLGPTVGPTENPHLFVGALDSSVRKVPTRAVGDWDAGRYYW